MSLKHHNFIRFLGYVRPYAGLVVLGAMGGVVKFTVPLLVPYITRHLLDNVFTSETLSAQEKLQALYWSLGGLVMAFLFIFAPWVFVRHYCTSKAAHRAVFDLRCDLYYRLLRMSSSFFGRNKSGEIVSRLISDIQLCQNLVGSALTNVWMDTAAVVVVVGMLLNVDVMLTLVALITFPLYLYSFKKLGAKIRSSTYEIQQEIANLSGNVSEKISGNVVVRAFTQERREERKFHGDSERIFSKAMRTNLFQSINMVVAGTLTGIAPLIVMFYGGVLVIRGDLTLGDLVLATMLLGPLYLPLQRFSELNVVFSNGMAALDRIFEVMDEEPEIKDKPDAIKLESVEGEVCFEEVSFHYGDDEMVLENVSFVARPGQKVALVGPSGSGKSTLVSLLPRFYDPVTGSVRIDGKDVRDLKLKGLRRHIGIVLQDPVLFSGPIRDNILYGYPEATDEQLIQACRDANALDFITSLPAGFDTDVGERGDFLSGGQKQRVTIARAFLKAPEILILDEPTSALDSASEQLIQDALERLMVDRTTFIVAHRLSTIIHSDLILVLEKGRIVEAGTHAQLVAADGAYCNLYSRQFLAAKVITDVAGQSS